MQLSLHPRGRLPLVTCTPVLVPSVSVLRNDSVYTLAHSRLDSLALAGNAPQVFGRVTRRGLPLVALVFNACFAALAYMTVSNSAGRVFNWFVNSEYSMLHPYMTLNSIPINSDIRFGPTDVVRYLPDLPPLLQGFQAARFRPRHAPLPRTFPAVCGLVGHDHEFTHLFRAYIFPCPFLSRSLTRPPIVLGLVRLPQGPLEYRYLRHQLPALRDVPGPLRGREVVLPLASGGASRYGLHLGPEGDRGRHL